MEELLSPWSLVILRAVLAIIILELVGVKIIEGVVQLEPLEQVQASRCHCPIYDHFHFPQEGHGFVYPESLHSQEAGVPREGWLERSLGIAVPYLEGRVEEVNHPQKVFKDERSSST